MVGLGFEPRSGPRALTCNHYYSPKVLPVFRVSGSLAPSQLPREDSYATPLLTSPVETGLALAVPGLRSNPGFLEEYRHSGVSRQNTDIWESGH